MDQGFDRLRVLWPDHLGLAREVASRHGLLCTFLGKPLSDRGGSGLHVNLSLTDENGRNAMDDPDADHGMSELSRQCVAGLVEHHEARWPAAGPTGAMTTAA